jgi:hypothetical protein
MAKRISASVGKGGKNKPVDTSGQVTLTDSVDESVGNPSPSAVLTFDAPATGTEEHVVVAYPIGDEFFYDPIEFGPATSLDFALDVLAAPVEGASHVDITLAVLQGDFFVASPNPSTPSVDGSEGGWARLSQTGIEARDFLAVDGSGLVPDFSMPFQFAYALHANYSSTALSVALRLDNMEATVNTVPEPSSLGLAMAMGAAMLWHRWWSSADG